MNTTLRNRTQRSFPTQTWTWFKATHFGGMPCWDAKIDGTYLVLRVHDNPDGTWTWASPNGMGISATFEQAKADAIADIR